MPTSAASTPHRGKLRKALICLALAPVGLWVAYLVICNIMLSTRLIARLASWSPESAVMYYDSAWSVWPGVVHVKGLRVSGADSVLQWVIEMDDVSADIRMRDLFRRTFTASHIRGTGYVFRVRLLVEPARANDAEVAALPPIPEFTNPPLVPSTPVEETTDENYDLWTAHLEDVDITLREVWIQQYRYIGEGRVRGGFFMRPLRRISVGPTLLELTSGELHMADAVVARLSGALDITMNPFDPRNVTGLDALETAGVRLSLEAQIPGLDFINMHLSPGPQDPRVVDGSGELRTDLIINRGVIEPGSFLTYKTSHLEIDTPDLRGSAEGSFELRAPDQPDERDTRIEARVRKATLERRGAKLPPAAVENASVSIRAPSIDVTKPLPKVGASINVPAAVLPDLRWLNAEGSAPERPLFLGGAAFFRGKIDVDPEGRASGAVRSLIRKASMRWKKTAASGDAVIEMAIGSADPFAKSASIEKGHVEVKDIVIKHGGETLPPWWATIDFDKASVSGGSASATVKIKCKDAQPAVALLDSEDIIPGWAAGLLTMEGLTASADIKKRADTIDFKLLRAQGGSLDIRGRLLSPPKGDARGAFLVKSGPLLSLGITMGDDGVGVHPLAGDVWVNEKMAALGK